VSSEKDPKPDQGAAGREDSATIELEERDLFSAWEPPPWDSLKAEPAEASKTSERRGPPPPPSPMPPSLPALVLPPVPDEGLPQLELGMTPIAANQDMSSLAPTVREQPPRQPERRGSKRPLIAGLAAFACAGALWIGMPRPGAGPVPAPHAATAGVVDLQAAPPVLQQAPPTQVEAASADSIAAVDAQPVNAQPVNAAVAGTEASAPQAREISVPAVTIDRASPPHARAAGRSKRVISSSDQLPDAPRREDVIGALNQLRGQLATCSAGRSGVAEIDLTIAGNGAVANALIGGDFAGTAQGSCLARTIRTARFAPFAQPRSRILYRMAL
jgi:hypothetical protein